MRKTLFAVLKLAFLAIAPCASADTEATAWPGEFRASQHACDDRFVGQYNDFACFALRESNPDGIFTASSVQSQNADVHIDVPRYFLPDSGLSNFEFDLTLEQPGFANFFLLVRGRGCEIVAHRIIDENTTLYHGSPELMLLDAGTYVLQVLLFNQSNFEDSCSLVVKPNFQPLASTRQDRLGAMFEEWPNNQNSVQFLFDLHRDLEKHLRQAGFDPIVDLSTLRVMPWNAGEPASALRASSIVAEYCEDYLDDQFESSMGDRGLDPEREDRSTTFSDLISERRYQSLSRRENLSIRDSWGNDLRRLEWHSAIYRSLPSEEFSRHSSVYARLTFAENASTLCLSPLLRSDQGRDTVAVSYELRRPGSIARPPVDLAAFRAQVALSVQQFFERRWPEKTLQY